MSKNPNDNENTVPYEQINAGEMRSHAEKSGSTGYNKQINPGALRSEAERHGNSGPNRQVNAEEMRSEAVSHGKTDTRAHARHERELAALDHKAGKEKGGR